jgi:hypothetical protein
MFEYYENEDTICQKVVMCSEAREKGRFYVRKYIYSGKNISK